MFQRSMVVVSHREMSLNSEILCRDFCIKAVSWWKMMKCSSSRCFSASYDGFIYLIIEKSDLHVSFRGNWNFLTRFVSSFNIQTTDSVKSLWENWELDEFYIFSYTLRKSFRIENKSEMKRRNHSRMPNIINDRVK